MSVHKAVAIVTRQSKAGTQILVFTHPRAGVQLVKGTIEPSESPAQAAVRELAEEAGSVEATMIEDLGSWQSGYRDETWHFQRLRIAAPLPEPWEHCTNDDGGHVFAFYWHTLEERPSQEWHPVFQEALVHVRTLLATSCASTVRDQLWNHGRTLPTA